MALRSRGRNSPGNLSPLDVMLAEIALRIQLSPTDQKWVRKVLQVVDRSRKRVTENTTR